jgi:hypothetical protein
LLLQEDHSNVFIPQNQAVQLAKVLKANLNNLPLSTSSAPTKQPVSVLTNDFTAKIG